MIRSSLVAGGLAIATATTVGLMSTSIAQIGQRNGVDRPQNDLRQLQRYEARRPAAEDSTTNVENSKQGHVVRASEIIGHNIVNPQDENVGEINDLVLDPMSGKIRYAAVTYGGFVGIGDKMFAVPWQAFNCRPDPENSGEYIITLDVTQQQLEGAQGFDEENWPNFADQNFTQDLDQRYGVQRERLGDRVRDRVNERMRDRDVNRDRGVDVDLNRRGVDVDVNPRD